MHANIYGNGKWHQPLRSLKFCLWDCQALIYSVISAPSICTLFCLWDAKLNYLWTKNHTFCKLFASHCFWSDRLYPCACCSDMNQFSTQASCWILQSFMHPAYTASTCWLVILNLVLNKADQPNPEEAEGFLDAAAVPVVAVPVCGAARHWAVRGQAPHQA